MNCSPPLHPDGSRSSENSSGPCHEHLGNRQFSWSCMDIHLLGAMNKSFCLDLTLSNWAACVQGGEIRGDLGQGLVFAGKVKRQLVFLTSLSKLENNRPGWPLSEVFALHIVSALQRFPPVLCSPQGVGGQSSAGEVLVTHFPKDHSLCSWGHGTTQLFNTQKKMPEMGSPKSSANLSTRHKEG